MGRLSQADIGTELEDKRLQSFSSSLSGLDSLSPVASMKFPEKNLQFNGSFYMRTW